MENGIVKVVLNDIGETLLPRTGATSGIRKPAPPDRPLGYEDSRHIGDHELCGWPIALFTVSETHYALLCRGCYMRVVIPRTVVNWGDLYAHFLDRQSETRGREAAFSGDNFG